MKSATEGLKPSAISRLVKLDHFERMGMLSPLVYQPAASVCNSMKATSRVRNLIGRFPCSVQPQNHKTKGVSMLPLIKLKSSTHLFPQQEAILIRYVKRIDKSIGGTTY